MPHASSSVEVDDLASSDEVKVFKDEGEESEERRSSSTGDEDPIEEMNELKQTLIDEEERPRPATQSTSSTGRTSPLPASSSASAFRPQSLSTSDLLTAGPPSPFGYYPFSHHHPHHPHHHPGSSSPLAAGNKVGPIVGPHGVGPSPALFSHMMTGFPGTPPPAHTKVEGKGRGGGTLPYPLGQSGQHAYPVFSEFAQHFHNWSPAIYSMTSSGFHRPPFPTSLSVSSPSNFSRFTGQPLIPPIHYPTLGSTALSQHPLITGSKPSHNDFMAAFAAINQHVDSRTLLDPFSQSQLSQINHHQHMTSGLSRGGLAPTDQKPLSHASLSRVNGSTGTSSPGGQSRSDSSPSSDCKGKIGSISLNNNRLNHVNQNHQNGSSSSSSSGSSNNGNNNSHSSSNHSTSSNNNSSNNNNNSSNNNNNNSSMAHVKKPLNAFMLYMKEQRNKVVAENNTLKESAVINQILGKKWHSLSREEQSKYYEMANREKQLHHQLYPGWTARDNYAINQKKKKKKRDKSVDGEPGSLKKCRARYGLDQQSEWCKPCRRKKKCIRYLEGADQAHGSHERDNLGSVGSTEAQTPDSKSANDSDEADMSMNLSSAELSLSSPPVANGDHHILSHRSHASLGHPFHPRLDHHHHHSSQSTTSSPSLASLQGPPRNSPIGPNNPLSIEQLTRPHRPMA